jgi:SNF2 family DNA or RNA helicase
MCTRERLISVILFQRRDFRVLAKALPPKQEYVLKVRLSGVQDKLYLRYLEKKETTHYLASDLFSTFAALAKVSLP